MKILFICPFPGPPFDGGNLYIYNILRHLAEYLQIYIAYYLRYHDSRTSTKYLLKKLGFNFLEVKEFKPPNLFTHWQRIKALFFSDLPPGVWYTENALGKRIRNYVQKLVIEKKIDIIHVWNAHLAYSLKDIKIPKVLTAGDCLSLIHKSYAVNKIFPFNLYYYINSRRFTKYEHEVYPYYQAIVFFAERDKNAVNLPQEIPQFVIPNGVDANLFYPRPKKKNSNLVIIGFHGSFNHYPNVQSANFLFNKVAPLLLSHFGERSFKIRLIGHRSKELFGKLDFPWLEVLGYVEELAEGLSEFDIYIAPIFSGAGIKNKVLEAMATGLPIIGTQEAFEGICIENGIHAVVAKSDDEFLSWILKLLVHSELRKNIGSNARKLVVRNYSWQSVARKYLKLYNQLVNRCGLSFG